MGVNMSILALQWMGDRKKLDFEQILLLIHSLYYVHTSVYVVVYVLLDKCLLHSAVEWKRTMLVLLYILFEKFSTQSLNQKFGITDHLQKISPRTPSV